MASWWIAQPPLYAGRTSGREDWGGSWNKRTAASACQAPGFISSVSDSSALTNDRENTQMTRRIKLYSFILVHIRTSSISSRCSVYEQMRAILEEFVWAEWACRCGMWSSWIFYNLDYAIYIQFVVYFMLEPVPLSFPMQGAMVFKDSVDIIKLYTPREAQ